MSCRLRGTIALTSEAMLVHLVEESRPAAAMRDKNKI